MKKNYEIYEKYIFLTNSQWFSKIVDHFTDCINDQVDLVPSLPASSVGMGTLGEMCPTPNSQTNKHLYSILKRHEIVPKCTKDLVWFESSF